MQKISLIILIVLLSSCVKKEQRSWAIRNYESAAFYKENANWDEALKYYRLTIYHSKEGDSIPYWVNAVKGEGEILLKKGKLEASRNSFSVLLDFSQRHKLLDEECIAWQYLGKIEAKEKNLLVADSCYFHALMLANSSENKVLLTNALMDEALIISAAYSMERNGFLSDSLYQKLLLLKNSPRIDNKVAALELIISHKDRNTGRREIHELLVAKDTLHSQRFYNYQERMEHEKANLLLERDAEANARQMTLFISLVFFALLAIIGVLVLVRYRRKHEMDEVQKLLEEKEQTINNLQVRSVELTKVRTMLLQKEQEIKDLEQRNMEMSKIRELLQSRENQLNELKDKAEKLDAMREEVQCREEELKEMENRLRETRFFESEIGSKIPSPSNPDKITQKEFDRLLSSDKSRVELCQQMDQCFNNFATGLQQVTPDLKDDDVVYCCLFRLRVRPIDIAHMMCVERSTVSMRRRRIEEKLKRKRISN